jgi:hypothetical protein
MVALIVTVALGWQTTSPGPVVKASEYPWVIDRDYVPEVGDAATAAIEVVTEDRLYGGFGAPNAIAYEEAYRTLRSHDQEQIGELKNTGLIVVLDLETRLRVLRLEKFPASDIRPDCAVVRILNGPHKGRTLWLSSYSVVRTIHRSVTPEAKAAKGLLETAEKEEARGDLAEAVLSLRLIVKKYHALPEATTARSEIRRLEPLIAEKARKAAEKALATKRANALGVGKRLETANKVEAAVRVYYDVVRDYPDSPEAKDALKRIKILTK